MEDNGLNAEISFLKGKLAWKPVRTYGSMFFLDIGDSTDIDNSSRKHGEWFFLVEEADWEFISDNSIFVSNMDSKYTIEAAFNSIIPSSVNNVSLSEDCTLFIDLNGGLRIVIKNGESVTDEAAVQWILYAPGGRTWTSNLGRISFETFKPGKG